MKARISARAKGALLFLSLVTSASLAVAGGSSPCDNIAKDVSTAVAKDPAKVLMIVEDALVINENCACEVVKAAIVAANADKSTVQQIVQTALAVAPKMAAVINECANAAAAGSIDSLAAASAEPTSGGKGAREVLPPTPPADTESSDFGSGWATNIRGVYLIQPAAGGFVSTGTGGEDDHSDGESKDSKSSKKDDDANDNDDTSNRANSRRTRNLVALSPAKAVP